jgi:hypothetical protein
MWWKDIFNRWLLIGLFSSCFCNRRIKCILIFILTEQSWQYCFVNKFWDFYDFMHCSWKTDMIFWYICTGGLLWNFDSIMLVFIITGSLARVSPNLWRAVYLLTNTFLLHYGTYQASNMPKMKKIQKITVVNFMKSRYVLLKQTLL